MQTHDATLRVTALATVFLEAGHTAELPAMILEVDTQSDVAIAGNITSNAASCVCTLSLVILN